MHSSGYKSYTMPMLAKFRMACGDSRHHFNLKTILAYNILGDIYV